MALQVTLMHDNSSIDAALTSIRDPALAITGGASMVSSAARIEDVFQHRRRSPFRKCPLRTRSSVSPECTSKKPAR